MTECIELWRIVAACLLFMAFGFALGWLVKP